MRLASLFLLIVALIPAALATKIVAQGENNPGAPPLILTDGQDRYPLDWHLDYLEDPGGQLTLEDVTSPDYAGQFTFSQAGVPKFGYSDSAFWVRFRVRNETTHNDDWRLEHAFANVQHLSFYLDGPDRRTVNTGTLHPFQSRDVPYHRFVFKVPLPPDAEQTVYLRVQSEGTILFPLILWRAETFVNHSRNDLFLEGLFFGALLLMISYNLFIWFFLRDRSYFYYALFLVGITLHQFSFEGFAGQYLWPNQPWLYRYAILFWVSWYLIFALLFAVSLLQTKTQAPVLHKIILFFFGLCVLVLFQLPFVKYSLVARQINYLVFAGFILLFIAGFIIWRKGYRPARYYLLAWSVPMVVNIFTVLALLNLTSLAHPYLARYSHRFGMVWLGLFLSLALADRINIFKQEREEAQAAALQASREHEWLIQEQNITLERQVTERTAALAQSNKELAAAKENAEKAQVAAETANQAKSVFLANMSHELRTPLNGILGYAQFLQNYTSLDQSQQKYTQIIDRSGQHLLSLIDDVLDIARIEAGKVSILPDDLHLSPFLTSISHIIQIRAEQKGLEFNPAFAPHLPAVIQADQKRLQQILINLLGNAVKFTNRGGVTFRVEAVNGRSEAVDAEGVARLALLQFTVEDTGPGIPAGELETIFQPFHQVIDPAQRQEGAGLGLAISQHLAGLMGSVIQARSIPGQGSVFWFVIETPVSLTASALAEKSTDVIIGYQGVRQTILLIDDLPLNRGVLREPLLTLGFEVVEADDGLTALEKAEQLQPDLILTDLRMPRLDGYELTRRVRQSERLKGVPVIGISASAYEEDRQRYLAAGGNAFVPKPVNFNQLLKLVAEQLPITWIYQARQSEPEPEFLLPLIAPPPAALASVQQLVEMGDIYGIKDQLTEIEALGAQYRPFVTNARDLLDQFQLKALATWLQKLT